MELDVSGAGWGDVGGGGVVAVVKVGGAEGAGELCPPQAPVARQEIQTVIVRRLACGDAEVESVRMETTLRSPVPTFNSIYSFIQ